jgi:predicted transcriptional regulator
MTDPTAARHGGNPFSEAAHASLTDKAKIRAAILTFIASRGDHGATSEEAEQALGLSHQTCSARFSELKIAEQILPAGRRPTSSGRSAGVWVAAPVQQALWSA